MDDLLSAAAKGDMDAFSALIQKYERLLYNIAYRIMGNPEDASDMTQEALIKIYKNLAKCNDEKGFKNWAAAITSNTCIDEIRKRKNKTTRSLDEMVSVPDGAVEQQFESSEPTPEEAILSSEKTQLIQSEINKLSSDHRAVIVLRDIEGFSYQEVADMTNVSLGTVKSRLARAREHLKDSLLKNSLIKNSEKAELKPEQSVKKDVNKDLEGRDSSEL